MSYETVKAYFETKNYGRCLRLHDTPCDTVPHAARNIGCEEGRIAKTMSFLVDEQPIVIVCAGDAKIKNNKYKAYFHKKAKMVPWEQVEEIIGHQPGGVCPFAVKEGVKAYLDVSLKRFADVHAAAGRPDATAHVTIAELEDLCPGAEWVDLCEDPTQEG